MDQNNKMKPTINIIFVGHVDAGKSTIAGQILFQLGMIDPRLLEKYKKESLEANRETWYLSWFTDLNEEERKKGKTTEIGRTSFELESKKIVILDAPGHKMYITNMITGAGYADVGVLVISARKNEFVAGLEGGSTKEHVLLSRAMGIKKLIILVNKMDDETVTFQESVFSEIKTKLSPYITKIYKQVEFIPISGFLGDNLRYKSENMPWYKGKSFLEYLNDIEIELDTEKFVFVVSEKIKNIGYLFGGKICSGRASKNQKVNILPLKLNTIIQGIYDDEECEIEEAFIGENVKIKLKEYSDQINEGFILCEPTVSDLKVCTEFTCFLNIMDSDSMITIGYKPMIHIRTEQRQCQILDIRKKVDGKMLRKKFVRKGESVLAKLKVTPPIVLYGGEDTDKFDNFSLRDKEFTIAIGKVRKIIE